MAEFVSGLYVLTVSCWWWDGVGVGAGVHRMVSWVLLSMGAERLWRDVMLVQVNVYKVKNCLFVCGKAHDLCKLQLVKDVTHVKSIKISTYNHIIRRVPHSPGIDGVNDVCHELLSSGYTWRMVDHTLCIRGDVSRGSIEA